MRTETGPLRIGEDWPGYFMRGDEALGLASQLRSMADAFDEGDTAVMVAAPAWLRRLAQKLEAVKE